MKKIFLLFSFALISFAFCLQAMALNVNDDEDLLDENIRKPGMSVRKHYVTPEEAALAAENEKANKEKKTKKAKKAKKKVLSKGEAERYAAEQKTLKEQEDSIRKAELEALLSEDYSLVQYVESDPEPFKWEDDEVIETPINSLKPYFNSTVNGDHVVYLHKDIDSSFKVNDFYFYFNTVNGVPEPLHFVGHYYADDAVEFERLRFSIDTFTYKYTPTNLKRSREGKFFAENFDNVMNTSDEARDLVAALAHCSYANMLLVSDTGVSHRIFFTAEQLQRFRQTYELFRHMGGKL